MSTLTMRSIYYIGILYLPIQRYYVVNEKLQFALA